MQHTSHTQVIFADSHEEAKEKFLKWFYPDYGEDD